jgi:hypothetical protein
MFTLKHVEERSICGPGSESIISADHVWLDTEISSMPRPVKIQPKMLDTEAAKSMS